MITQTEIAKRLGISQRTVSSALRGVPGVKEDTAKRILELAKKEGYRPNRLAAGLRGAKTASVGIIWSFADLWTNDAVIAINLMHLLQDKKVATYQAQQSDDTDILIERINDLLDRQVDALVFQALPEQLRDTRVIDLLKNIPSIAVCRCDVEEYPGDIVIHDRNSAINEIVDHLARVGVKKPAFMISMQHESNPPKYEAFLAACRRNGISEHKNSLICLDYFRYPGEIGEHHRQSIRKVLDDGGEIDAIFCFNDIGAFYVMDELRCRGIRVPEDMKLVGFNNIQVSGVSYPPLASGDRCGDQMTSKIAEFLDFRLHNPDMNKQRAVINMRFIWRESAGAFI